MPQTHFQNVRRHLHGGPIVPSDDGVQMFSQMELVAWGLTTLVTAFLGSFLASYLKNYQSLGTALSANNGYVNAQNLDASLNALRKAIEQASAAVELRPRDWEALTALATNYKRMGDLTELHDRPAATTFFQQAIGVLDRIPAKDRDTPQARNARSSALLGPGWNLGNLGDFAPALKALEEARQIRDRISEEDPQNIMALYFRGTPYRNLGIVSGYAGHPYAKLHYFLIAIGIGDRLRAKDPANRSYRFSQAEMQADSANLQADAGRPEEALRLARAGLATLKDLASDPQASPVELAVAARALGDESPGHGGPKAESGLGQARRGPRSQGF